MSCKKKAEDVFCRCLDKSKLIIPKKFCMLAHGRKDLSKLSSLHTKNLRKIVRVFWPDKKKNSNQDLIGQCQQKSIEITIALRQWRWMGHILRKDQGSIPRVAVEWKPEVHRKRGCQRMTWRRTFEAEATAMGHLTDLGSGPPEKEGLCCCHSCL